MARSVLACVISVAALIGAAPAEARHRVCPTEHAVARTNSGVVFYRVREARKVYYGCLWRVRKTYRLQQVGEFGLNNIREPRWITLVGRFVAYPQDYGSTGGEANTLSVRDLVTGKVIHQCPVATRGGDFSDVISALVLKRNGSVAWTTRTSEDFANATVEVRAMDSLGAPRELDSSPRIDPASLRLSADRTAVSWVREGTVRAAPLN